MKIKVCGMKHPENIESVGRLPLSFMGFIFYDKSPRYADVLDRNDLAVLSEDIKRVGVFVNADFEFIKEKAKKYNLDFLQLHGQESAHYCQQITSELNIPIIKAFNVSDPLDFDQTKAYEDVCEYFLFDTKTSQHGGSGLKFDWNILNNYRGQKPFFLSGGISAIDADSIKQLNHPKLYALDLNSKFELEPGLKDAQLLDEFIKNLNIEL